MKTPRSLNWQVGLFTFSRLTVNTSVRMVYPFLAVFAAGLNVEVGVISLALAISMATSAVGPFIAPLADRRGRKFGILVGVVIFLAGTLAASLFPGLFSFFLAIMLGNLGNNIFLPSLQAYLGDHTPYQRRAFYLAITELSWALSFILLIPLAGLLIEETTWYGPYMALSVLGVLVLFLLWKFVPADQPAQMESINILADLRKVLTYAPALLGILMGTVFITGNEVVTVVFGLWMQDSFGLQIAALGAASMVIGLAELSGEGMTALIADRLGKERTIALSLAINALWVIALPWLGRSLPGAFVWLFVFFFTFELSIVSALPLMSEVTPSARATTLSLFIAALSLGRAVGDVVAPLLYRGGFIVNALACVAMNLLALLLLSRIKIPVTQPKTITPGTLT